MDRLLLGRLPSSFQGLMNLCNVLTLFHRPKQPPTGGVPDQEGVKVSCMELNKVTGRHSSLM